VQLLTLVAVVALQIEMDQVLTQVDQVVALVLVVEQVHLVVMDLLLP
jgi:hypothetical protein